MTRSNKNIIIAVLIALMLPLGCKDSFLEQENTFQSNADALSTKREAVIGLVNGIYDTYQNSDLLKKCIWYRANFGAHDFFNWGADVFWNNYQIPSTFGGIATFWNQSYIGIARANSAFVVISKAESRGVLTTSLANRLRGEAFFLRGLTYYYLASSFGGVPLEIDTTGATNLGLKPRSPRDSVFMQVVADMQQAATLLWSKKDLPKADQGRATKGAAYAYEGAARMWLKDYAGALIAFNNPELTNNYRLLTNFADVHEYDNQNNDESLFEIQFAVKPGDPQDWGGSWNPPGGEIGWIDSFSWPEEITQQGYDYGNPALWNSFQEGDKRKLLTIVGPGDPLVSPGIIRVWGGIKGYIPVKDGFASGNQKYKADDGTILNTVGTKTRPWYGSDNGRTGYYCAKKWRDYNLTGGYGPQKIFGDQNQILMRYAEVLLSRAECKVRTGNVAGALADLKLVRDRAWGGTAPAIMKDSANFDGTPGQPITDPLQMVLSEYRHELSGEYSLFYLLCRAGTNEAIAFIKKANGTVDGSYEPIPNPAPGPTRDGQKHGLYNTSLTPEKTLLPIPQVAISLNPNLTPNP
ncbi:MAG TPA: RagB/SusD family nutrient uptake outer membrane protein [Niastella sp.]